MQKLSLCILLTVAFLLILLLPVSGLAVVITDGDGTGNVMPPEDDPGFANIGILNDGSGIYLGNRWVLTAAHVGAGSITLNDLPYGHLSEETVRLKNTMIGLTPETDILLMRLEVEPDLPALHAGCRSVSTSREVMLVGGGRQRDVDATFWLRNRISGRNNDVWTEVENEADSNITGYFTSSSRIVRWGTSRVTRNNFHDGDRSGDVSSFQTEFIQPPALASSAQAVHGDSGGAVFQKNGGIWELVGMIHAVGVLENQPRGTLSAVFGGTTLAAELYDYLDQIRAVADFEPTPGDFDGDGEISAKDIDQMFAVLGEDQYSCHFDFDEDRTVSHHDMNQLLTMAGTLIGDANLNGAVGFDDFLTVARSFGDVDVGWADGDFDGDQTVTFGDFLFLSMRYGDSFTPEAMASPVPVPETTSARFVLLLGAWISFSRRRHR